MILVIIIASVAAFLLGLKVARYDELDRWRYLLDTMETVTDKLTEQDSTYYVVKGVMLAYDVIVNEKEIEIIENNT